MRCRDSGEAQVPFEFRNQSVRASLLAIPTLSPLIASKLASNIMPSELTL